MFTVCSYVLSRHFDFPLLGLPVSASLRLLPTLPLFLPVTLSSFHASGTKPAVTLSVETLLEVQDKAVPPLSVLTWTLWRHHMSHLWLWSEATLRCWQQIDLLSPDPNLWTWWAKRQNWPCVQKLQFFLVQVTEHCRSQQDKSTMHKPQTDPDQSCVPLAWSQKKCLAKTQHSWDC